jgi:hypothetical protein
VAISVQDYPGIGTMTSQIRKPASTPMVIADTVEVAGKPHQPVMPPASISQQPDIRSV